MSDRVTRIICNFGEAILKTSKDSQEGYSREDITMNLLEIILRKHAEKSCSAAAGLLHIHQVIPYDKKTDVYLRSQMYDQVQDLHQLAGFYNSLDEFYLKHSVDENHQGLTIKLKKEILSLEEQAQEIDTYLNSL